MASDTFKNDGDLISYNTTDMNLNAGDVDSNCTVPLDAGDNDIEMGGVVTFDGDGDIAHPTSADDVIVGTVVPESSDKGDSTVYSVNVFGHVFAAQLDDQSGTDIDPGDTLYPSTDYEGAFTGGDEVAVANTDDTDVDLYMNHPVALESGTGGDDGGDLDGDVILAFYR